MAVKVVEGEASHVLNTSEVRAWMVAALCFQTQRMDSGVAHVLYACEGVYHVTPPHPPVCPVSLVRPASHSSCVSCASRVSCTSHVSDFDNCLVNHSIQEFKRKNKKGELYLAFVNFFAHCCHIDLLSNAHTLCRLRTGPSPHRPH